MAITQLSNVIDTAIGLLPGYDYNRWTQLMTTRQNYFFFNTLLRNKKVIQNGGSDIRWTLAHDTSSNAGAVGLFQQVTIDVPSVGKQCSAPYVTTAQHTMYDEHEISHLTDAAQIFDYIKMRSEADMLAHIELLETQWMGLPTTTTDGTTQVRGIPYYCTVNSSEGFNGGDPSGHSSCAGVASASNSRWKNYTAQYAAISYDDLIAKMRTAANKTMWTAPIGITDNKSIDRAIVTTLENKLSLETLARNQNDQVGRDLAAYDGKTTFWGNPVVWVPRIDEMTGARLYMLDMNSWEVNVLKGFDMKRKGPWMPADRPLVHADSYFLRWQITCKNRRQNAVFATSAASNGT